jgi:hypothetical protein
MLLDQQRLGIGAGVGVGVGVKGEGFLTPTLPQEVHIAVTACIFVFSGHDAAAAAGTIVRVRVGCRASPAFP